MPRINSRPAGASKTRAGTHAAAKPSIGLVSGEEGAEERPALIRACLACSPYDGLIAHAGFDGRVGCLAGRFTDIDKVFSARGGRLGR